LISARLILSFASGINYIPSRHSGPIPIANGIQSESLSENVSEGGMIDGDLRRAVLFPDDKHPDLCAYAINVTGTNEMRS
jgi:hypothetical protein